ncbi:MAG: TetR/AcrR family transcriptional regulator [Actinobacteria bacterium]|nr:TetR/AcrR family transcriptional regulator [Actinomycetota bacterium]
MAGGSKTAAPRKRVPAAERRDALIEAAMHEFARGGLHGTKVSQVARAVGVAQPYVFALFPTKIELFLAAVGRGFERIEEVFEAAAKRFEAEGPAEPDEDVLMAIGRSYVDSLTADRDMLLLQLQAYAACEEPGVREAVRGLYAGVIEKARELSGADDERLNEFFSGGMYLNVVAALGVEELEEKSDWVAAVCRRSG